MCLCTRFYVCYLITLKTEGIFCFTFCLIRFICIFSMSRRINGYWLNISGKIKSSCLQFYARFIEDIQIRLLVLEVIVVSCHTINWRLFSFDGECFGTWHRIISSVQKILNIAVTADGWVPGVRPFWASPSA